MNDSPTQSPPPPPEPPPESSPEMLLESSPALPLVKDHRVPVLPVIGQRALKWAAWGTTRILRRQFAMVGVSRRGLPPELPDKPVLLYCNHPSIWTPSLGLFLATRLWPAWRHYAPANQAWIHQRHLPLRAGFFPIATGRRGVRQFMATATNVLACPGSMLWMGASLRPVDARRRPVHVQGVVVRLARLMEDITLLPLAIEHGYAQQTLPRTLVRFGEPLSTLDAGRRSDEGWRTLLQRRLGQAMDRLGEEACDEDPGAFQTLL